MEGPKARWHGWTQRLLSAGQQIRVQEGFSVLPTQGEQVMRLLVGGCGRNLGWGGGEEEEEAVAAQLQGSQEWVIQSNCTGLVNVST